MLNNSSSIVVVTAIILMASIVVFTGLKTPDTASFAKFTNDVDTVYTATIDKFADLKVEHAIKGDYRTNEQIYIELATGKDPGQYGVMHTDTYIDAKMEKKQMDINAPMSYSINSDLSTGCQHISVSGNMLSTSLPYVREYNNGWYVTSDGRIFNATGYVYDGKTYFDATYHAEEELPVEFDNTRPEVIARIMNNYDSSSYRYGENSSNYVVDTK